MSDEPSAAAQGVLMALDELYAQRAELRRQLGEVEAQIKRHEAALNVLNGDHDRRTHTRSGTAVLAALRSYSGPVTSATLLANSDLANYAEATLRRALTSLHRQGLIVSVERTSKGQLWAIAEDGQTTASKRSKSKTTTTKTTT